MQLRSSSSAATATGQPPPSVLEPRQRASKRRGGSSSSKEEEQETPRERVLGDQYMLAHILAFLEPWDTGIRAAAVCRAWFAVASSSQLCKALIRRHWPSMLDLCSGPDSGDAYRLLHQRAYLDDAPGDLRRWEEARLLKAHGHKTVEITVSHPKVHNGYWAVASVPILRPRADYPLLMRDIPLRCLLPEPPSFQDWDRCKIELWLDGTRVWGSGLFIQRDYHYGGDWPHPPQLHPAQVRPAPFFRTTDGEERWRVVLSDTSDDYDAAIHLTLDFGFPASTLEPPLSPIEQVGVASAVPIGIHGITVSAKGWLDHHEALHSRFTTLKTFDMLAKRFDPPRPRRRQLAERFRGCAVVLELLDEETWDVLAYHCSPVVVTGAKSQLPDIFRQRGVPLTWVDGVEPLTKRSKLKKCDYQVLFLDARHGCVLPFTEYLGEDSVGRNIEPFPIQVWLQCVIRRGTDGGMRARLEASFLVPEFVSEDEEDEAFLGPRSNSVEGESRKFKKVGDLWRWLDEALTGHWPGWEYGDDDVDEDGVVRLNGDMRDYIPGG